MSSLLQSEHAGLSCPLSQRSCFANLSLFLFLSTGAPPGCLGEREGGGELAPAWHILYEKMGEGEAGKEREDKLNS